MPTLFTSPLNFPALGYRKFSATLGSKETPKPNLPNEKTCQIVAGEGTAHHSQQSCRVQQQGGDSSSSKVRGRVLSTKYPNSLPSVVSPMLLTWKDGSVKCVILKLHSSCIAALVWHLHSQSSN